MKRLLLASLLLTGTAQAQTEEAGRVYPVIRGYGGVKPTPNGANRPDPSLSYKVVFNITKAAPKEGAPNVSLSKVARFLNLLGEDRIAVKPGDVVPIVQHDATSIVLSDKAYAARFGGKANPDAELIAKLKAAGAQVHVCAQALAGKGFDPSEVSADVVIDDSALMTLSNLQLKGYALIPD